MLIEQSDPKQRERILADVQSQDPEFLHDAMRRVVFFEELVFVEEGVLAEILSQVSPKVLAYAMQGVEEMFRNQLVKMMGHVKQRQIRDEEELMSDDLSEQFINGARKQVLKIARQLEAKDKFTFEVPDAPRFLPRSKKKVS